MDDPRKKHIEFDIGSLPSNFFKEIFESMAEGIQILDHDFRYIYVNDSAASHGKNAKEDLLGNRIMDIYPGIDQTEMFKNLKLCMEASYPQRMENRFVYPNGSIGWFELRMDPIPFGVMVRSIEVTKEKEYEQRHMHGQKMEAIGRLAGGIAHDFNNTLLSIMLDSEVLIDEIDKDSPLQEPAKRILHSVEKSALLTRQLLIFSSHQIMEMAAVDLNAVLNDSRHLLDRLIGDDMEIELRLDSEIDDILIDPSQLDQIIFNLAINARDAMPDGGKIIFATREFYIDEEYIATHPNATIGHYVQFTVSDTGHGIDPKIMSRIFEPFFTTKAPDKGTGLGLATVHGIVKQSGGHIEVYSEPGTGTTFRIYFKNANGAPKATNHVPEKILKTYGTETIMIVDDNQIVGDSLNSVLTRAGYTIYRANSAKEALKLYDSLNETLHLLISDVVMPGLSGPDLADILTARNNNLKVILMSGHTEYRPIDKKEMGDNMEFIQKPAGKDELLKTIRMLLDKK